MIIRKMSYYKIVISIGKKVRFMTKKVHKKFAYIIDKHYLCALLQPKIHRYEYH